MLPRSIVALTGVGAIAYGSRANCDAANDPYSLLYKKRNPNAKLFDDANAAQEFSRIKRKGCNRNEGETLAQACTDIRHALALRCKYFAKFREYEVDLTAKEWEGVYFKCRNGVCCLEYQGECLVPLPSVEEFMDDLQYLRHVYKSGFNRQYCYRRLKLLEHSFQLYKLMNNHLEMADSQDFPRDFYTVCKVDNHIHMAAAITSHHLLKFLQERLEEDAQNVVMGSDKPLSQLVEDSILGNSKTLTVEKLNTKGGLHMFDNFQAFNNSYNIGKSADLRTVFLKTSGEYLDDIARLLSSRLSNDTFNVHIEPRLSIYGRSHNEWEKLSKWIVKENLLNLPHIFWMVQIPRVFPVWHRSGLETFGEMMRNVFEPMFQATMYPEKHPEMAAFLETLVGLDTVDDESVPDNCSPPVGFPHPDEWVSRKNPNYSYYCYYIWANLANLNAIRKAKGLERIAFRPHSGETGPSHHMASAFMLSDSIAHGIRLHENTVLQYLFYLAQVGISVSPLSNNCLFKKIIKNPFHDFFMRGLNTTLSTDDPLQFHNTNEPLLEEYAMVQQLFKVDHCDVCEIAKNSVEMSGLPHELKLSELGEDYESPGAMGCDSRKSGVPQIRAAYRHEMLLYEFNLLMRKSTGLNVFPKHWTDLTFFPEENGELRSEVEGAAPTQPVSGNYEPPELHIIR